MLNLLLQIPEKDIGTVKVRCSRNDGEKEPIEEFLRNPEKVNTEWLFWRREKRFYREGWIAISLVDIGPDRWLLTTIKRVTKVLDEVRNGVAFEADVVEKYAPYFGRVIVSHHKDCQSGCRFYYTVMDNLVVEQVLDHAFTCKDYQRMKQA